jgi:hypothetical protein
LTLPASTLFEHLCKRRQRRLIERHCRKSQNGA